MHNRCLLFLTMAMASVAAAAPARETIVESPAQYVQRLVRALRAVERAERLSLLGARAAQDEVAAAARLLQMKIVVEQTDETVAPDLTEVVGDLQSAASSAAAVRSQTLQHAKLRLISLLTAAREAARAEAGDFAGAQRVLHSVLKRREFQSKDSGTSMQERFMRWLLNVLESVMSGVAPGTVRSVANALLWGAGAALVVLLVYLMYAIAPLLFPGLRSAARGTDPAVEVRRPVISIEELMARAQAARAGGDFREALHLVFRAMLLTLDRQRLIQFDESRSNGEYLLALRREPRVHATLAPVARSFDEKWYGGFVARADDVDFFLAQFDELHRLPAEAAATNGSTVS